jgi:hypothetical protein
MLDLELEPGQHRDMEVESVAVGTQASQVESMAVVTHTSQSQDTDGDGRKPMASRSEMWQHFVKITDDKGIVRSARCKYCSRTMKADSKANGTSSLKRHFNVCKRNPHKFNKDPAQGILQTTQGEVIGTWRFD